MNGSSVLLLIIIKLVNWELPPIFFQKNFLCIGIFEDERFSKSTLLIFLMKKFKGALPAACVFKIKYPPPPLWSFFKNYVQNQNKESKFAEFWFYTNCKLLKKNIFSLGSFPRVPIVMTLTLYCQLETEKLLDLHDISYYTVW